MMPNLKPEAHCARSPADCRPCKDAGGARRRLAAIVAAICIVLAVCWGEVWAIEHGSELAAQCSAEFTNAFASAFNAGCGATTAPIAIIH